MLKPITYPTCNIADRIMNRIFTNDGGHDRTTLQQHYDLAAYWHAADIQLVSA